MTSTRSLTGLPAPVTVRAPAKVNLHLSVGPRGDDGFHPVTTVLQAVSLYDTVVASAGGRRGEVRCEVEGEGAAEIPAGDGNLAVVAARRMLLSAEPATGVRLHIDKNIPVAGGLAGGSADAAATLVACDALWQLGTERAELEAIGSEIGSDVPFAITGGTALGTGRGEQVTSVLGRGVFHWVLALAERGLSTSLVYTEFDRGAPLVERPPDDVLAAVRAGDAAALGRALHNDLQPAALRLRPALRRVLDAGLDAGALAGVLSGSGPTCAFLTCSAADATAVAAALSGAGVCRAVRTAHGPVAGARVVERLVG